MIFLLLTLVVLLSYGQILGMGVWQDDNGLFFKLAHVSENAGYLSAGPFGSGPYKYIHTAHIPIYALFGFNTVPYFVLSIVLYLLTSFVIYKIYKSILGRRGGMVAGFIYAAGYIASDGFIRLFNTVVTSVSVVTISLFVLAYWKFFKLRKVVWYFLAVIFYFLSIELARGRTHYLIGVVLAFEVVFFRFTKPILKSLFLSLARLTPFLYIFYLYFIKNADHRSANVGTFVNSLLRGDFYQLFGFLSSVANLFIPDWLKSNWLIVFGAAAIFLVYLYKRFRRKIFLLSVPLLFVWAYAARFLFSVPQINPSEGQKTGAFIGGVVLVFLLVILSLIKKEYRKIYVVLVVLALGNIVAYSAYNPLVVYESINRYLAHSLFAVAGIWAIVFVSTKKRTVGALIILFGLGNVAASVVYQNNVLRERSIPAKNFYSDLKSYVKKIEKDDVFYFDVADNSRGYFADAFSVASMPETTAIAWRYGVDRYDLYRVTDFNELLTVLKDKKLSLEKVHSFFYSGQKLQNTTDELRERMAATGTPKLIEYETDGQIITFKEPVSSVTPNKVYIDIKGQVKDLSAIKFPYVGDIGLQRNRVANSIGLRKVAFGYDAFKKAFWEKADVVTSSNWRGNININLADGNQNTLWQPDRILWGKKEPGVVIIDSKELVEVDRIVWTNAYANNSPTHYRVEGSVDGKEWQELKEVQTGNRIESWQRQIVNFPKTRLRFVRMVFLKTLNSDSPGISEVWVVPSRFAGIDINEAEEFIANPFGFLSDATSYLQTLRDMNYKGDVNVYIKNDKYLDWKPLEDTRLQVAYNSNTNRYSLTLPAGGTTISMIKLSSRLPGDLMIGNIFIEQM